MGFGRRKRLHDRRVSKKVSVTWTWDTRNVLQQRTGSSCSGSVKQPNWQASFRLPLMQTFVKMERWFDPLCPNNRAGHHSPYPSSIGSNEWQIFRPTNRPRPDAVHSVRYRAAGQNPCENTDSMTCKDHVCTVSVSMCGVCYDALLYWWWCSPSS